MTQLLKGKLYWVKDDFSFIGGRIPKGKNSTSHTVAEIENVLISDTMIKFTIKDHKYVDNEIWNYQVELIRNSIGINYEGEFHETTETDHKGAIHCELFQNEKKYMLYGRWSEYGDIYTFWAIINK